MKILGVIMIFVFLLVGGFCFWNIILKPNEQINPIIHTNNPLIEKPLGWPWHGVTVATHYDLNIDKDLTILEEKGVNFVSIYLKPRKIAEFENISGEEAFKISLKRADSILDKCRELNLYAMIYFSEFPVDPNKGRVRTNQYFWDHKDELEIGLSYISRTIDHFKLRGTELQAYQFVGEPVTVKWGKVSVPDEWEEYFKRIHSLIRNKDKNRFIIYGPGPGGKPEGYKDLEPIIDDPKIIYSFHYYLPHSFSHQGIRRFNKSFEYPGKIDGKDWNKETILNSLIPVLKFQNKYNKLVFVGEFSALHAAKGWEKYFNDQVEIYLENKFGYTYFTFNGWKGWAISDKNQSSIKKKNFGKFNVEEREKRLELLSKFWKNKINFRE